MTDLQGLVDTVRRDGFVVVRGFLPRETVARAHAELEEWYRKDLEDRQARGVATATYTGVAGTSVLTPPSHLLIDVYGKSPAFDALFEKILTDPLSRGLLTRVAGERFKMRGYNIRRMTGAYDPPPAHEWHRDSPGEFGIGIFLTDVAAEEHGATALVPGSHLFPFDPRWNTLFPGPYRGVEWFQRHNPMSRRLGAMALRHASGAYGKRGDFYIFINDVWHGRQPNLRGSQSMVALLGAFPTEFPYPDIVPMPSADVLERLSPAIREVVRQDQPPNEGRDTVLHWMLANRQKLRLSSPFLGAWLERRMADALSFMVMPEAWAGGARRSGLRGVLFRAARSSSRGLALVVFSPRVAAYYARKYFKLGAYYARLYPRLTVRWVYRRTLKRWMAHGAR